MLEAAGRDLWALDYTRAHVAYVLFMTGFGVGYRLRRVFESQGKTPSIAQILTHEEDLQVSPYEGGLRCGWLFEPLGAHDDR